MTKAYTTLFLPCPLCIKGIATFFGYSLKRPFFRCTDCELVFLHPQHLLSSSEEKSRYDLHQNSPEDQNYVNFLSRLAKPLLKLLRPGSEGLDFGSGPGPTLHLLLEKAGMKMENFDPFYQPDKTCLNKKYDFITCTEVAEHFYKPRQEFDLLNTLLKQNGILAIMTAVLEKTQNFENWHYAREESHVSFYSDKTLKWIANHYHWQIRRDDPQVIFFARDFLLSDSR